MKKFLMQATKNISAVLLALLPALLLPFNFAHAASLVGGLLGIAIGPFVNVLAIGIPFIVGYIGGFLLTAVSYLVNYLFYLNTAILPDKFRVIEIGYSVSLSLANTILVIALIIIAFATILNVEEYTAKKKLGQVISTAVMVNFGLLIVGALLDLSHVLTKFFLSGGEVGTTLGGALGPQKFLSLSMIANWDNLKTMGAGVFEPAWFKMVAGVMMLALFTWILFIVMSAVAGMFVWRYIKLIGLIITLPFAWALALLPGGSEKKSTWWHDFIQAAFFLPGAAFFIYLAIKVSETISASLQGIDSQVSMPPIDSANYSELPQLFLQMIVVIGILMYGLKQALSMGGEIAKKGMDLGRKLSDRVVSRAERSTRNMYSSALNRKPGGRANAILTQGGLFGLLPTNSIKGTAATAGKKTAEFGKNISESKGKLGQFANLVLGGSDETKNALESMGGGLQGFGTNFEGYTKRYEEMDHGKYEEMLKKPPVDNPAAMAALLTVASKRGDVGDLEENAQKAGMNAFDLAQNYKALNPEAAHHPDKNDVLKSLALSDPKESMMILGKETKDFLRSLDGGEVQKLNKKKFDSFADGLTPGQLNAFGRKNGENEQLVMDHWTNATVSEAKKTNNQRLIDGAKDVEEATQKIDEKKTEIKTASKKFEEASHHGDTQKMREVAEEISKLRESLEESSRARNKILRSMKLNKNEREDPKLAEFGFALANLTEAAKGIGGTGSREKAAESHHAHPPKSKLVDFAYTNGGSSGGDHGGGGHGH